jgi:hypothetical protein
MFYTLFFVCLQIRTLEDEYDRVVCLGCDRRLPHIGRSNAACADEEKHHERLSLGQTNDLFPQRRRGEFISRAGEARISSDQLEAGMLS